MIPKRRKREKFGTVRKDAPIRCPGHRAWIRGHDCILTATGLCYGKIEAAHVRTGTDGGTGKKPSDCYVVPMCGDHHAEQHMRGERLFESEYKVDMKKIAAELWDRSPHGVRYRAKMAGMED